MHKLRGCTLVGTGSKVPDRVLTNADLEKMVDTSDEWIVSRSGIRERRISGVGEAVTDLALPAAEAALEMAGLSALDLDKIIVATVTPDRMLPSASCTMQERLGATHAAAFDLNAACSGFVYGMGVGASLIASGAADTVLVIGAETLSKIVDYEDRSTCVLFGDGAGAAILRPCDPGHGILASRLRSDGSQGHVLEIPAGGSRLPASHETVDARGHYIKMKGNELFKFSVRAMETVTRQAIEESGVPFDKVRFLVPHQANLRIINAVAERLGIGPDRLVLNIDRLGNTSAASIPISLDELLRSGRVQIGDVIGMVAFGGGVTWGAIVLEWNPALAYPIAASRAQATAAASATG